MSTFSKARNIEMAQLLESAGDYGWAERLILEVLTHPSFMIQDNRGEAGSLYINLGQYAVKAEQPQKAITYFRQAIELLDQLKGDFVRENAHAHFNLGNILLDYNHPTALDVVTNGYRLYTAIPFCDKTDKLDSLIQVQIAKIFAHQFDLDGFNAVWVEMRKVDSRKLYLPNLITFVVARVSMGKRSVFPDSLSEFNEWADERARGLVKDELSKAGM